MWILERQQLSSHTYNLQCGEDEPPINYSEQWNGFTRFRNLTRSDLGVTCYMLMVIWLICQLKFRDQQKKWRMVWNTEWKVVDLHSDTDMGRLEHCSKRHRICYANWWIRLIDDDDDDGADAFTFLGSPSSTEIALLPSSAPRLRMNRFGVNLILNNRGNECNLKCNQF